MKLVDKDNSNKLSPILIVLILIFLWMLSMPIDYISNLALGSNPKDSYMYNNYSSIFMLSIFLQIVIVCIYTKVKHLRYLKRYLTYGSIGLWIFCLGFIFL